MMLQYQTRKGLKALLCKKRNRPQFWTLHKTFYTNITITCHSLQVTTAASLCWIPLPSQAVCRLGFFPSHHLMSLRLEPWNTRGSQPGAGTDGLCMTPHLLPLMSQVTFTKCTLEKEVKSWGCGGGLSCKHFPGDLKCVTVGFMAVVFYISE